MTNGYELLTSGVYGLDSEAFFGQLVREDVALLVDVRDRRGMRGPTYAYANSQRLQAKLQELGILYYHAKSLAPPADIRELQKQADTVEGVAKRERTRMSRRFEQAYRERVLSRESLEELHQRIQELLASVDQGQPLRICMLCVEADPGACHRSLLAEELAKRARTTLRHL